MALQPNTDGGHGDLRTIPLSRDFAANGNAGFKNTARSTAVEAAVSEAKQVGSIVGNRYELQSCLGAGELGLIYEAVDQQLTQASKTDHLVALELITLNSNQEHFRSRMIGELVGLLTLSHPNIARVIDFGIDGSSIFYTTEMLHGASLESILSSNSSDSFSQTEVLAVMRGAADALRHAHTKGYVHGNLKCASIFITDDFDIKLTDFAGVILKRVFGNIDAQRIGDSQKLKPTTDVFGLAAVAYEMLANEPPYDGLPRGHARKKEMKLRRIKGVPLSQWSALANGLRLQPSKRTKTVDQFVAEFGVVGTESLDASNLDDHRKSWRWLRPTLWFVAATAAIVLVQSNYSQLREFFVETTSNVSTELSALTANTEIEDIASPNITAVGDDTNVADDNSINTTTSEPNTYQDAVVSPDSSAELGETDSTQAAADTANDVPAEFSPPTDDEVLVSETESELPLTPIDDTRTELPTMLEAAVESAVIDRTDSSLDSDSADISQMDSAPIATEIDNSAKVVATSQGVPEGLSFSRNLITVSEGQGMVAIEIRRGSLESDSTILWWTEANTATADRDYADFGVRTEKFTTGSDTMTVYIPLVSDSHPENQESFSVFVGSESMPRSSAERLEVVVRDDDR